MAENTTEPTATETVIDETEVVEQNFVTKFAVKHPRITKVAAITGTVTIATLGALTVNTVRKNRHHLETAGDHLLAAGSELSASVSPTDAEA